MNITAKKNQIRALLLLVEETERVLNLKQYQAHFLCDCTDCPTIARLKTKLETVKQEGREAVFELMLHMPHRQFLKFIQEHT
jgi:hypothetical protein